MKDKMKQYKIGVFDSTMLLQPLIVISYWGLYLKLARVLAEVVLEAQDSL